MKTTLLIFSLFVAMCRADISWSPYIKERLDAYVGNSTNRYWVDSIDRKTARINDWVEKEVGKPMPTDDSQLPDDATAIAMVTALKTDAEKERESVDSAEKLRAEVISLRKELEALKKEKQR